MWHHRHKLAREQDSYTIGDWYFGLPGATELVKNIKLPEFQVTENIHFHSGRPACLVVYRKKTALWTSFFFSLLGYVGSPNHADGHGNLWSRWGTPDIHNAIIRPVAYWQVNFDNNLFTLYVGSDVFKSNSVSPKFTPWTPRKTNEFDPISIGLRDGCLRSFSVHD